MKKIFFFLIFLLSLTSLALAQFGNETITIVTYYPSPHGVYGVLTMFPRDTAPEDHREGDMYFNSVNKTLLIYREDTQEWEPAARNQFQFQEGEMFYNETNNQFFVYNASDSQLKPIDLASLIGGGGGGGNYTGNMLVNGAHTEGDCAAAGGTVVASDVGLNQCRFNASTCPSGWTRYKDFITTQTKQCSHTANWHGKFSGTPYSCTATCTAPGHSWANAIPACCSLRTLSAEHDGECLTCPTFNGWTGSCCPTDPTYSGCTDGIIPGGTCGCFDWSSSSWSYLTCVAPVTQIGCY